MRGLSFIALLAWALLAWAAPIGNYQEFLGALAQRESSNTPNKVNKYGYAGLYQMGELALIDAGYYKKDGSANNDWRGQWTGKNGVNSLQDFLNHPQAQTAAVSAYHQALWNQLQAKGLDKMIGQQANGVIVTPSGLLAGAHLIGAGGMSQCLATGSGCADANGTKAMSYMSRFSGYDVASVTGGSYPTGDGSGGGQQAGSGGGANAGGGSGNQVPAGSGDPLAGYTAPSPSAAFSQGAGVSMAALKTLVLEILSTGLLIWVAWVSLGQFSNWRSGEATWMDMQTGIVRALVLMSLMLAIFLV